MEWREVSLDLEENQPLYRQIAERIGSLIDAKALTPGERIPTSKELMGLLNVGFITVEAGIGLLVDRKYLIRRPRKGTFVNPELGFGPLRAASGVDETKSVGLIFRGAGADDFYWLKVLWTLERRLRGEGFDVSLLQLDGAEDVAAVSRLFSNSKGLIFCGHLPAKLLRQAEKRGIPFVLIGGLDSAEGSLKGIDAVSHDDVHRACISTAYLIDLGHKDVFCVCGPKGSELERALDEGYRKAMREAGLPVEEGFSRQVDEHSVEAGVKEGFRMLSVKRRPSAVFAGDDRVAAGIMQAALKLGLKLPQDLSVVGCGGLDVCRIVSPKLTTTVSQPERSAELAAEKLFAQFEDPGHLKASSVIRIEEISYGESAMLFRKGL